ncbi:MAG: ABC transporter permease [Candidatus Sumerlaeia bacterium]|nr:ABC transporter permease [Candidatus Sumerlaeia bacterium]
MSTPDKPEQKPATGPAPGEAQSYWDLALRDLRRNKLAIFGLLVVFLVVFIAVHAPLLANQRPLYLKAVFREDFINEMTIAGEEIESLLDTLSAGEPDQAALAEAKAGLAARFTAMKGFLAGDESAAVAALGERVVAAVGAADSEALQGVLDEYTAKYLDPYFDDDTLPPLGEMVRYPAVRSLNLYEVWFMSVFWLAIAAVLGRRLLPGVGPTGIAIGLLATLIAFGMREAFPPVQDNTPYRRILDAPDFQGKFVRTLVPFGENENIIKNSRVPPNWAAPVIERMGETWENPHFLGTDTNGRDVTARMVYGARVSMMIGIFAVSIYVIFGIIVGASAGYFRGWTDILISRVIEVVICFPFLMMILAVQAFLGPSIRNIILVLAFFGWTSVARLQRGEFLRLVNMDFVAAVRALGGSNLRIIFLHILPNAIGPILVLVSFAIAGTILSESALSFLGFGVPQPMASWGDLLNNGRSDPKGLWWLTVIPGLAIFFTVTCFNLLGEGFRDALDPRRDR